MINKKIIRLFGGFILCVDFVYGQGKTFSGTINKNSTWEGAIVISGDVSVPKGVTLTIKPGTTIKFLPNTDDQRAGKDVNRSEIIVDGILIANASRQTPIKFTSNSKEPQAGDWYGIQIKNSKPGEINSLDNCIIEYAYDGIFCFSSSPNIFNSRIQICYNNGIRAEVRANPILKNNNINNNGYAGIFCNLGSNATLTRNTITQNKYGVFITNMSSPILGVIGSPKENEKGENRIFDNIDANIYNQSQTTIIAQNNDWGTANPATIDQTIYDQNDNRASGMVTYTPVLAGQAAQQLVRQQQQERRQVAQLERQTETGNPAITSVSQPLRPVPKTIPSVPPPDVKNQSKALSAKENKKVEEVKSTAGEPTNSEITKNQPPSQLPPTTTNPSPTVEPISIPVEAPKIEPPKVEEKKEEVPAVKEEVAEPFEPIRSMDELDSPPEFKKQIRPTFPSSVSRTIIKSGSVTVYLIVDKNGDVEYSRVVRPIGNKEYDSIFNQAATVAAKEWKFKPGTVAGKKVKFNIVTAIKFE